MRQPPSLTGAVVAPQRRGGAGASRIQQRLVVPERTLRSSLVSNLAPSSKNGALNRIDKSLITTLREGSPSANEEYIFNFDKLLLKSTGQDKETPAEFKLVNEVNIAVKNRENHDNVFQAADNSVVIEEEEEEEAEDEDSAFEAPVHLDMRKSNGDTDQVIDHSTRRGDIEDNALGANTVGDQPSVDKKLLLEKSNLKIINITKLDNTETITTRKGNKIVKPHRINLRKKAPNLNYGNDRNNSRKKLSITNIPEDFVNDPLHSEVYSRYHKAKLKTEKSFASSDKGKFLDDVANLKTYFTELIQLLHADTRSLSTSYVNILLNFTKKVSRKGSHNGTGLPEAENFLKGVEYSGVSSFVISYINFYYFKVHKTNNSQSPNYHKLLDLLENDIDPFNVNHDSSYHIPGHNAHHVYNQNGIGAHDFLNGHAQTSQYYKSGVTASIPGPAGAINGQPEKHQYNSLRHLLQRNEKYCEEFKNALLSDKGYKEQFETGHMRNNSSLNFNLEDYELQQDRETLKGQGSAIFNSYQNFEKVLVQSEGFATDLQNNDNAQKQELSLEDDLFISAKLKKSLMFSSDRLLHDVNIRKDLYPIQITSKDKAIIKTLKKLTFVNPYVINSLEKLAAPTLNNKKPETVDLTTNENVCVFQSSNDILSANLRNFTTLDKILKYLTKIVLLTVYETFKLLKFFKGYWNNKNEYLSFMRNKEHQKILKNVAGALTGNHVDEKPPSKYQKKVQITHQSVRKAPVNKHENFEYYNVCLSDPEASDDDYTDYPYMSKAYIAEDDYSDPDNDATLEELRAARQRQSEKKYIHHYRLMHEDEVAREGLHRQKYYNEYDESSEDEGYSHHVVSSLMVPNTKKFVFNTSKDTKIVFDPRFGTKFFNTEELRKFEKPEIVEEPGSMEEPEVVQEPENVGFGPGIITEYEKSKNDSEAITYNGVSDKRATGEQNNCTQDSMDIDETEGHADEMISIPLSQPVQDGIIAETAFTIPDNKTDEPQSIRAEAILQKNKNGAQEQPAGKANIRDAHPENVSDSQTTIPDSETHRQDNTNFEINDTYRESVNEEAIPHETPKKDTANRNILDSYEDTAAPLVEKEFVTQLKKKRGRKRKMLLEPNERTAQNAKNKVKPFKTFFKTRREKTLHFLSYDDYVLRSRKVLAAGKGKMGKTGSFCDTVDGGKVLEKKKPIENNEMSSQKSAAGESVPEPQSKIIGKISETLKSWLSPKVSYSSISTQELSRESTSQEQQDTSVAPAEQASLEGNKNDKDSSKPRRLRGKRAVNYNENVMLHKNVFVSKGEEEARRKRRRTFRGGKKVLAFGVQLPSAMLSDEIDFELPEGMREERVDGASGRSA